MRLFRPSAWPRPSHLAAALLLLSIAGCGGGRPAFGPASNSRRAAVPDQGEADSRLRPNVVCGKPPEPSSDGGASAAPVRIAVFGDYGTGGPDEGRVAALVKSWNPAYIFTTGDNNYPSGAADTIDANIGQFYHQFISPYRGRYGCSAEKNRFFPSLGNHDWYTTDAKPYRDYFELPGNERYYDVVLGDVHLFALDSDPSEPDGITVESVQAAWLKMALATSSARWKVVTMHHPPYSSGPHLSTTEMRWPFKEWGADVVFAGHDHDYERLVIDGLPYVVSGLGGASLYTIAEPLAESVSRFDANFGAVLMTVEQQKLTLEFITVDNQLIDKTVVTPRPR